MAIRTHKCNKFTKYEIELLARIQVLASMVENYEQIQRERDLYKRLAEDLSKQINEIQAQVKAA